MVIKKKDEISARITKKQLQLIKKRDERSNNKKVSNLQLKFKNLLSAPADPEKSHKKSSSRDNTGELCKPIKILRYSSQ